MDWRVSRKCGNGKKLGMVRMEPKYGGRVVSNVRYLNSFSDFRAGLK